MIPPKAKKRKRVIITILVIVTTIGLMAATLLWVSYANNPDRLRAYAYTEVSKLINTVSLDGEMVHTATRDDGCHEYTRGFASGTSCTVSGERMYVSSKDIDTNINDVHHVMVRKGWTTEGSVQKEINRFKSEDDRVMWISYYNKSEDVSLTLLVLKRSSEFTGWGRISDDVFNNLKVKLDSSPEYVYGFVTSQQYRDIKENFFSRKS